MKRIAVRTIRGSIPGPKRAPARHQASLHPADRDFVQSLVIYDDRHVLGFNKPSGLAVQGGAGVTRDFDHLLAVFATSKGRIPRLVHRLDRETSGVMIAARTKPAAAFFSAAFAERRAQKTYLALVFGDLPKTGVVDLPLMRVTRGGIDLAMPADPGKTGAQAARTRFRVIGTGGSGAQLLAIAPETGRMHQIRAHLAALGTPIAGDRKYGGVLARAGLPFDRLHLHALALRLPHPDGCEFRLTAPPGPDLLALWRELKLAGDMDAGFGYPDEDLGV